MTEYQRDEIRDHCQFLRRCITSQNVMFTVTIVVADLLIVALGDHDSTASASASLWCMVCSMAISQNSLERGLEKAGLEVSATRNSLIQGTSYLSLALFGWALFLFARIP